MPSRSGPCQPIDILAPTAMDPPPTHHTGERWASFGSSTGSPLKAQEELINALEAEEERIVNVLSRKLEQLREEKIDLENTLEAESEAHVNRLQRELAALRLAQQQHQQASANGPNSNVASANGSVSVSPETRLGSNMHASMSSRSSRSDPHIDAILDALRRENEQLRNRLVDTERDYVRISRLNEIYREELIEHRNRLGLPVDNLIGMSSPEPYSQPIHRRSSSSSASSPSASSVMYMPRQTSGQPSGGVPIPRPPSQIHRPSNGHHHPNISVGSTPLSHSPSSTDLSPFPLSPNTTSGTNSGCPSGVNPGSYVSTGTAMTSPPNSMSFNNHTVTFAIPQRGLSYPSVPPPSASSSFGSATYSPYYDRGGNTRDPSLSPIEPLSRRNSNARRGSYDHGTGRLPPRVVETGSLVSQAPNGAGGRSSQSRRESVERGGRIAESGSLISNRNSRSRAYSTGSTNSFLPSTMEGVDDGVEEEERER